MDLTPERSKWMFYSAKPIIFSTDMVKAILDGRKTQTRRVIRSAYVFIDPTTGDSFKLEDICHYNVGDILWVRETWARISDWTDVDIDVGLLDGYIYCADWGDNVEQQPKWKPSIHMPKEAARIFLKVKDVRAERLQEITEEDAVAEGFPFFINGKKVGFSTYWDNLNAKRGYGWETNPWVWVIEFERIKP